MRVLLVGWWLAGYAALAHADVINLADGLASIPILNVVIAVSIAFVGGAAWTSQKEAASVIENKKLVLTVISDLLVSMVAGLGTYFLLSTMTESTAIQAFAILIAGYGGTRIMDGYVSVLIDWATGIFKRKST